MNVTARWLPLDNRLKWKINGVTVSTATHTRREEYWWVRNSIINGASSVLDAATGFINNWHMLPYILANDGFDVTACDRNPKTMLMPSHPQVVREVADITALPYANEAFDVVCCISVLEHLNPAEQRVAATELLRVARKQLLVTADRAVWLPELFASGIPVELLPYGTTHLEPPVVAVDIRK